MLCQEMNDFHFLSQESCMTGAFACFQSGLRTCFAITYLTYPIRRSPAKRNFTSHSRLPPEDAAVLPEDRGRQAAPLSPDKAGTGSETAPWSMRRRTRWAPETGRKAIWHPSWGGYRVSPPDPDGTKSPAACSIPEFCRKRSAHIRTGASSLHSSPGNGGYAWHPPYNGFVPYLSPSIETGGPVKGTACQSSCYLFSFCFRLRRYRTVSAPARTRAPAPMPR